MTGDQLKLELQRAGLGHIEAAAQEFGVHPSRLLDWISGKEVIPDEMAERAWRLPDRRLRSPGGPPIG
jgi:hypothetical protein